MLWPSRGCDWVILAVLLAALENEHRVTVAVESVAFGDGLLIGFANQSISAQCLHQDQQCAAWQMEIGEQCVRELECVGRAYEEIRGICPGLQLASL